MTIDLDNVDFNQVCASISTDKGDLELEFYPDKAPKTVRNWLDLAKQGFYDGLTFHRVLQDFMIQGGCPDGTGKGGPGYMIPAEFNDEQHRRGTVSMARTSDPDSAGCQFFIVHAEHAPHLDGKYTVFARVAKGLSVLDSLASVEVDYDANDERSRPVEALHIKHVALKMKEVESVDDSAVGMQSSREDSDIAAAADDPDGLTESLGG